MTPVIGIDARPCLEPRFEAVERKGLGHPDTIADRISEGFSREYSRICLGKYGRIPNHWVDKCIVRGGMSSFEFGAGKMLAPIEVELLGKVTTKIGSDEIPIARIASDVAHDVISEAYPLVDCQNDIKVCIRATDAVGAGRPSRWYRPNDVGDIPATISAHTSNDMSICAAHAPLSRTEIVTLDLEARLNSPGFRKSHPMAGSDVKVITIRHGRDYRISLCVPAIASRITSREDYDHFKSVTLCAAHELVREHVGVDARIEIAINTRDDRSNVYMSHLGGAIDTGDVGVTGRGNRANGLITPGRPMSIEAPAGKNPMYHGGKIYSVVAQRLADEISTINEGIDCSVIIVTETGRALDDPVAVNVALRAAITEEARARIRTQVEQFTRFLPGMAAEFVEGRHALC